MPPSVVLTVIVAEPTDLAVTSPVDETVATDSALDDHVTDLSVAFSGVTVAVSVRVSPSSIDKENSLRLTPVTEIVLDLTVTEQVAVLPPSFVFTVIVAEPADLAITSPADETVATDSSLEVQETDLSVAFSGVTVAISVRVSPSVMDKEDSLRLTPVTETVLAKTVTEQVAVLPPSLVLTVIVAEPAAFAVTTPPEDTDATDSSLDDQVTDWSVALVGDIIALSVSDSPSVIAKDVLSKETLETCMIRSITRTRQVAVLPPSSDFAVTVAVQAFFPVIVPSETVTLELSDDQITFLLVALSGEIVAVMRVLSPSVNSTEV